MNAKDFFGNVVAPGFKKIFSKGPSAPRKPGVADYYGGPQANWGDTSSWVQTGRAPGAQAGFGGQYSPPHQTQNIGFNGQTSFDRIVNGATLDPARFGYSRLPNSVWNGISGGGSTPGSPGSTPGYVPAGATVQGDEQGRAAQMDALRQLQGLSQTGWSPTDQASFAAGQRQANLGEQSQREAVLQQAAARGQSGGGVGLMSALAAQQGAANRSADIAAQIGSEGANRRLGAIQSAGALGGSINDQTFAQQQARAQAIDTFNQQATQNQANAVASAAAGGQQAWENENTRRNTQWNRITGGIGLFNSLGGSD